MTPEGYKLRLKVIDEIAEFDKKKLCIQYMNENAKYKGGDVVEDHIGKILVEKVRVRIGGDLPLIFYEGIVLKKDGTFTKKVEKRKAFELNMKG